MRVCPTILATLFSGSLAWAQTQNPVVIPPAPPIMSAPLTASPAQPAPDLPAPPPGLVQTPVPPAPVSPGSTTAATTPPAAPDTAPAIPNTWLPGKTAILGVLDKVDGGAGQVSIPVGGQANVGDLQVSVQSCVTRPPDQLPDTAIFLTVQNSSDGSGSALYRGWMVRSAPGATVVGDASETFRVINCS
jgi:hypothetical protein